jgi:hypothetical protein
MDKDWQPVKDDAPVKKPKSAPKYDTYTAERNESKFHMPSTRTMIVSGVALILLIIAIIALTRDNTETPAADVGPLNAQISQQQQQIVTLTAERDSLKAALASQPQTNTTRSAGELDKLLAICSTNENKAKAELKVCQQDVKENDALIADAGRRLCCIARVNDASIKAYDIKNDRIICVSSGGTTISC